MRLSPPELQAIVEEIHSKAPDATIYLYGSRADDRLRGGDIDLLVVSAGLGFIDKLDLLLAIKSRIGDQKIDLKIVSPDQLEGDAFAQSVLPAAVRLKAP